MDMRFQRLRESLRYLEKVGSMASGYGDDFYNQVLEARKRIPITDVYAHKHLDDIIERKGNALSALASIGTFLPGAFGTTMASGKVYDKLESDPATMAVMIGGLVGSAYGGHKVGKHVAKNLKLKAINRLLEKYPKQQPE